MGKCCFIKTGYISSVRWGSAASVRRVISAQLDGEVLPLLNWLSALLDGKVLLQLYWLSAQ